jgi:opacity protein-like surface antigen
MRKIGFVAIAVLLFASLASAQVPTSGNIYVGYSFENTDWSGLESTLNRPNLQGWEASLEGKIFPHVGIVTDFSQHFGSANPGGPPPLLGPGMTNVTGHGWEILFGPRLSIPIGNITPFAEAMFGVGHISNGGALPSSSNTSFATALGGGLDFKILRPLALRFEGDYLQTRFYSTTQNAVRLSTGVVFRF